MSALRTFFGATLGVSFLCSVAVAGDAPATAAAAPPQQAPAVGVQTGGDFTERTEVVGKPDVALKGIWLLNAIFVIGKDNYKNIPQVLKITDGKDGPEFHLVDVELPEIAQKELKKANDERPRTPWVPSKDAMKALAEQWSKLPRRPIKGPADNMYASVEFILAAADKIPGVFLQHDPQLDKVLEGSKFALQINEKYKPQPIGDARISPLITRRNVYGAKTVEKDVIKGDQVGGFLSAGSGQPLPINVAGQFEMYRVTPDVQ